MRLIKIGFASLNTTVGAFHSNADKVLAFAHDMEKARCTVGCCQEQVLSGYPAEDLIQWQSFVDAQWQQLERFARHTAEWSFPTVFTLGLTVRDGGQLYNAMAVVCQGVILGLVPKEKLPTYGVFYERRTFSSGIPGSVSSIGKDVPLGDLIFRFPFGVLAVEVCEDIWSPDGPMRRRAFSGAELVINGSASPWRAGVTATRQEMIATRAADNQVTVVYTNEVGGNDSLVFDGGGFINQNGRMLSDAPRWREGWTSQVIDLDRTTRLRHENTTWRTDCEAYLKKHSPVWTVQSKLGPAANHKDYAYPTPAHKRFFLPAPIPLPHPVESFFDDLLEAMVAGLDYFVKTKAFTKIGIALSGGKDSTLTLIVAYLFAERRFAELPESDRRAAIREFIHCFSMPSRYNSATTQNISRTICAELGVTLIELPIEEAVARETAAAEAMLAPGEKLTDLTRQNIQTRIRGQRMWNWANATGAMWLQTSNMSEKAVGYTTIGGDMMGAYSLIANLPKTVLIELLGYLARTRGWKGVKDVLATTASAELAPNQEDERDLMPFPVLDACFALFAGEKLEPREVYQAVRSMWTDEELRIMAPYYQPGMLREWVKKFARLFVGSIFKWVQTPQAVHLGTLDLDRERALQLPVVQSREWLELDELDKRSEV